jgi:hypothetical protein
LSVLLNKHVVLRAAAPITAFLKTTPDLFLENMPKRSNQRKIYERRLQKHASAALRKLLKAAIREDIGRAERILKKVSSSFEAEIRLLRHEFKERLWDISGSLDLIAQELARQGDEGEHS